jgi:CubicO group peptidase (beta-lactamase class C family)
MTYLLAIITILGTSLTYAVPDVTNSLVVEAFVDGAVKSSMQNHHSSSGVVAVMKNGEMIIAKGYGYIDVEKQRPVDPKTSLFRPGSISKLFTWIAVMQQVERGRLDLDRDVNQYLKTFQIKDSWPDQPVTLRHIMTHTAGFEDGILGYVILDDVSKIIPLNQSLAKYQPERVNAPGEHVAYSNWAAALAGLIVAKVSGVEFNEYIQRNIFDVLGMKSSSFVEPLPPTLDANMAKAYDYAQGKYYEKNYEIVSNFGPAGAAAVTAYDMALFAQALLNDGAYGNKRILKAETLQRMLDEGFVHDDRVRGMGLGFIKHHFGPDGFNNVGHGGATTIFISHFGLSLKEDFMLFSSFAGPGAMQTHAALVKAFYDEFFPREVPKITPPADFAERAERYAGTYHSWRSSFTRWESLMRAVSGVKVISMPDNTLLIGTKRYVELEKNLFRETDDYGRIAFQENEKGEVVAFVIDGSGVMQFYKAPFYETLSFLSVMVGLSFLIFIGVGLQLAYRWKTYRALQGTDKTLYHATLMVAVTNSLFVIFSAVSLAAQNSLDIYYEIPGMFKFSLIFPLLATFAAIYHLYRSIQMWSKGLLAGLWPRLRYSGICVAALSMAWFYYYWNLLGFKYFS